MPLVHELHYTKKEKKKEPQQQTVAIATQASNACLQETSLHCFVNPFLRMANQKAIEHQKGRTEMFE